MSQTADANPLDAGSNANSVESAATGFDRLFETTEPVGVNRIPEEKEPRARRAEPKAPDAGDDEDGQADPEDDRDPILDGTADEEDGEEDPEKDDADDEDEDDQTDDDDDDDEHEVTVNGKVEKVKTSELIAGYAKEADYRQKTARLSEERREVEEFAQESVAARQLYVEGAQNFIQMASALAPSKEEWDALKTANPTTFIAMQDQWREIAGRVAQAKEAVTVAEQNAAKDAERQHREYVMSEGEKLFEKVPSLANPKKAAEFHNLIMTYGKAAGYSEDELLQGAVDHRDVLTLYKAARFDEIQRSKKAGQRPSKPAPREAVASSKVRVVAKTGRNEKAIRQANRRAASTGSMDDAALAFDAMMKG